jgi:hypothetical protein
LRIQHSGMGYGPIAMQRKRLAQTDELIEQYSKLAGDSANGDRFRAVLARAIQRKRRMESWLAAHEKAPNRADWAEQFLIE